MFIPYEEKDDAKERGMKFDGEGKCWFLPPGRDPLPLRKYWSYLEKTYEDRAELKKKGCRYNGKLKKWYVPQDLNYNHFTKWWPEDLRRFLFLDQYAVLDKVKESSGQADVYKTMDVKEDKGLFAVKIYKVETDIMSTNTQRNAANAEIKTLEKLDDHLNVLKLVAWALHQERQTFCLVSPWMPGGNLDLLIGTTREEKFQNLRIALKSSGYDIEEEEEAWLERISEPRDAWLDEADLLIGILEGLRHLHSEGIYHRDLKPANVMLDFKFELGDPECIPVLCDFGAAKIRDENSGPSLIESKHTVVDIHTKAYRWPFDILSKQGQKERKFQHTWDLVSWAVIAVEMVANINVGSPAEALEVLNEKILQNIDPEILKLIERALSKNPGKRPQDIDKFCSQIVDLTERRKKRLKWEN